MKDRTLLMIPGPIEFEPDVLQALGAPTTSHVSPDFIDVFGQALERMRKVFQAPSGQPFVLSGSGTLAMDCAGANLIEPGDRALVLSTGVFGDRFEDLLGRYGAEVTVLRFPLGETVDFNQVKSELDRSSYKVVTATHVDTSTAVRVDPQQFGELGRQFGVLTILDGVCSVAGEKLHQEEWGIDVVLTASQKAIGVPPGLALLVVSKPAIEAWRERKAPARSYYADWEKWLPIMEAYEERRPSYFGTPAVNLICALNISLGQILDEGLDERISRHCQLGKASRAAFAALGLGTVPTAAEHSANTLSAPRYPDGVTGADLLPKIRAAGAILAGGLHPAIQSEYFRIGHMGATKAGDLLAAIGAVETGLKQSGYDFELGIGVGAAQRVIAAC
ncbi:MAG: alanine--glyoxylate aminotransferase family protein [bacterium]|nr:alanine--glyoxylate aminotransferase family protein [bacterium]